MPSNQLTSQSVKIGFKFKEEWEEGNRAGYPPSTIIEQLMETAVASNMCIQQVAALEQQLAADHPHLNTIYSRCSRCRTTDVEGTHC